MNTKYRFSKTRAVAAYCLILIAAVSPMISGCRADSPARQSDTLREPDDQVITAGFLVNEGVFNSELMAPYDVFHHSIFRDSVRYIHPFIVSADGLPVETFEGITIHPHYSYSNAPRVNILVIPSTAGSMSTDLADTTYMSWIRRTAAAADFVITVCDGAFPLAETGALNHRKATTFPGDRDAFAKRYPAVEVRYEERFVADGKYITSVGGAMSYEPALYLVEHLFSADFARQTAEGLVWDWDLQTVPHLIVREAP